MIAKRRQTHRAVAKSGANPFKFKLRCRSQMIQITRCRFSIFPFSFESKFNLKSQVLVWFFLPTMIAAFMTLAVSCILIVILFTNIVDAAIIAPTRIAVGDQVLYFSPSNFFAESFFTPFCHRSPTTTVCVQCMAFGYYSTLCQTILRAPI